jgi:hypothetical protein
MGSLWEDCSRPQKKKPRVSREALQTKKAARSFRAAFSFASAFTDPVAPSRAPWNQCAAFHSPSLPHAPKPPVHPITFTRGPGLAPRHADGRGDPHPRSRTVPAGAAGVGSRGGTDPAAETGTRADIAEATRQVLVAVERENWWKSSPKQSRSGTSQSMKLWNRLFPSEAVKQGLAALDELRPLFRGPLGTELAGPELAFDGVRQRLKKHFIEHPEYLQEAIQKQGVSPRNTCLIAIANITGDDLTSGWDHIYRGMLGMVGQSKRSIYNIAMEELEKAGVCTAEERRMDALELRKAIREIG